MTDRHADILARVAEIRPDIAAAIPGHVRDHLDCRLIVLGSALLTRWAAETRAMLRLGATGDPAADAEATAALDRTGAIVDDIVAERARTIVGLGVQALVLAWFRDGKLQDDVAFDAYDASEDRVAAAIRCRVLALDDEAAAAREAGR